MSERVQMVVCPDCCGAKLIGRLCCDECKGHGVVPAEREEWRMIGADCRKVRTDIRQTLADVAHSMGMTMPAIARMEAGFDNPEPLYRHWFSGVVY